MAAMTSQMKANPTQMRRAGKISSFHNVSKTRHGNVLKFLVSGLEFRVSDWHSVVRTLPRIESNRALAD